MSEPKKHHYIPEFYLHSWTSDYDKKLCVFSRPYRTVKDKRRYPAETGFKYHLYSIPGAPPGQSEVIESHFMSLIDSRACDAYRKFLRGQQEQLTVPEADAWARFLYVMTFRNPENLASIHERYRKFAPEVVEEWRDTYPLIRKATDPPTFDEFKTKFFGNPFNMTGMHVIPRMLNSDRVIGRIRQFTYWTARLSGFDFPKFLTSDRPIIMNNGVGRPDAHMVMPLSPNVLFIGAIQDSLYHEINDTPPVKLAKRINEHVASQSHEYVYGHDASQLAFVAKRLGKKVTSTPFG